MTTRVRTGKQRILRPQIKSLRRPRQKSSFPRWVRNCLTVSWICYSVVGSLCQQRFRGTTTKLTMLSGASTMPCTYFYSPLDGRENGIGSTSDPGPSHQYDNNKTEVLRLLLVLLSRQIYVPPGSLFSKPSLYTLHLVQQTPRRDVLTLLCSLLNTAMNSPSASANITSIGSMAGKLPYNHLVFKGEDPRSTLVGVCFQVLVVLLDFQGGSARDIIVGSGDSQTSAPTARTNAFRYFLMKLVCI